MSGSGRMNVRLASSYREDDHRRAADDRRPDRGPPAGPRPRRRVVPARPVDAEVIRVARAAIRRLVPRIA